MAWSQPGVHAAGMGPVWIEPIDQIHVLDPAGMAGMTRAPHIVCALDWPHMLHVVHTHDCLVPLEAGAVYAAPTPAQPCGMDLACRPGL